MEKQQTTGWRKFIPKWMKKTKTKPKQMQTETVQQPVATVQPIQTKKVKKTLKQRAKILFGRNKTERSPFGHVWHGAKTVGKEGKGIKYGLERAGSFTKKAPGKAYRGIKHALGKEAGLAGFIKDTAWPAATGLFKSLVALYKQDKDAANEAAEEVKNAMPMMELSSSAVEEVADVVETELGPGVANQLNMGGNLYNTLPPAKPEYAVPKRGLSERTDSNTGEYQEPIQRKDEYMMVAPITARTHQFKEQKPERRHSLHMEKVTRKSSGKKHRSLSKTAKPLNTTPLKAERKSLEQKKSLTQEVAEQPMQMELAAQEKTAEQTVMQEALREKKVGPATLPKPVKKPNASPTETTTAGVERVKPTIPHKPADIMKKYQQIHSNNKPPE